MKTSFFVFCALFCVALSWPVGGVTYTVAPGATILGPLAESDICNYIGYTGGCSSCVATNGLCHWAHEKTNSPSILVMGQCVSILDFFSFQLSGKYVFNASATCPPNPRDEPAYATMKHPFRRIISGAPDVPVSSGEASQWFSSWFDSGLAAFPTNPWPVDRTSVRGIAGGWFTYLSTVQLAALENTNCAALTKAELFKASNFLDGHVLDERDRFCAKKFLDLYLTAFCPAYGVPITGICASTMAELEVNCNPCITNVELATFVNDRSRFIALPFFDDDFVIVPDDTTHCIKEIPELSTPHLLALAGVTPTSTPFFSHKTSSCSNLLR